MLVLSRSSGCCWDWCVPCVVFGNESLTLYPNRDPHQILVSAREGFSTMLSVKVQEGEVSIQTSGEFEKAQKMLIEWDVSEGDTKGFRRILFERHNDKTKMTPRSFTFGGPLNRVSGQPSNPQSGLF